MLRSGSTGCTKSAITSQRLGAVGGVLYSMTLNGETTRYMYWLICPPSDAAAALGWKNSHLVAHSSSTSRRCSTSYFATSGFSSVPRTSVWT